MRADLRVPIQEAIANSSPPPNNEADTCARLIYPLLLAAGYSYHEILSQDPDAVRQRPDYTLLPNLPEYTWFLEAKAWSVNLVDSHAQQAVNYANTKGKRWVVLTNGKVWRLYDNHIKDTAEQMLAATFRLDQDEFPVFLEAISKHSITNGKLESFVRNQRLYATLTSQFRRPDSEVVRAVTRVLRTAPGLSGVTASEIVSFFERAQAVPTLDSGTSAQSKAEVLDTSTALPTDPLRLPLTADRSTFAQLTKSGPQIVGFEFGGKVTSVKNASDLVRRLCKQILDSAPHAKVPTIGPQNGSWYISPTGEGGKPSKEVDVIESGGRKAFVDQNNTIANKVTFLSELARVLEVEDGQAWLLLSSPKTNS